MALAAKVGRGVAWVASGEAAGQVTQFLAGIVLARLLAPSDFGLMVMAAFVSELIEVFGQCGLIQALMQREGVTEDDWSSVYWFGVGMGVLTAVLTWVLAPAAALFYQHPDVVPILRARGWVPFLASLGATQEAWLRKCLQFRMIAVAGWLGIASASATAVSMAWLGWGIWSLVVGTLVAAVVKSLWLHNTCSWQPKLRLQRSTLKWTFAFGMGWQGFAIINYFNRHLDDALIGRYIGQVGLGYYSRAYTFMLYPVNSIAAIVGHVLFPALSSIGDDLPRLREAYLRATVAITAVAFPAMCGLLVTAPEVILVLYGQKWLPTVPMLQVLCMVGLVQSVTYTLGWIYMVRARTDLMFAWGIGSAAVLLPAFFAGLPWGVMGVAIAYAIANGVLLIPSLVIPFRLVNIRMIDFFRSIRGALGGSAVMAGVVALVREWLVQGQFRPPTVLALSVSTGIMVYLGYLWLTGAGILQEARVMLFHRAGYRLSS